VVKRVFGIGEHGAEAHFVVGFERWGRPWGGAGIEFRTDSEQMGRRELVIGWEGERSHIRRVSLLHKVIEEFVRYGV
jgi:hypothetical protein